MPPSDQAIWFAQNIQPHEAALRAYLFKRFPTLPDHDDLLQESYLRTLRAHEGGRVFCARAYLFTTVRNVAIDIFRRRRGRENESYTENTGLPLLEEVTPVVESLEREQRHAILLEAILALPERCRQVMMLRHIEGLSYKEIAAHLGISPETVKVHMIKGVKECTRHFHQRGLLQPTQTAAGGKT